MSTFLGKCFRLLKRHRGRTGRRGGLGVGRRNGRKKRRQRTGSFVREAGPGTQQVFSKCVFSE